MNHVAFSVPPDKIDEYRDRLLAAGIDCTEVANHDDSEWGISEDLHAGVFVRVHLLPGPRRDPARVRLLDAESLDDGDVAPARYRQPPAPTPTRPPHA